MKLVCFYDIEKYKYEERVFAPSAATVIDYIAYSLNRIGVNVEIISPAETRKNHGKYLMRSETIDKGIILTQGPTTGYKSKIMRILTKMRSRLWLVKYLRKNTKDKEVVFFWDSPVLYEPLLIFRRLDRKRVKILYFASEIFQEVLPLNKMKCKMEWKLFNDADMLFASTKLLEQKVNISGKKSIILHGTYKSIPKYDDCFDDGKVHILYAGVINKTKGSSKAIEIAKYLPENYHINIIGYGQDDDVKEMLDEIEKANKTNICKITYDGVLRGDAYNRYLQKCDIGLCSQNLDATYNESSFPSKILSYMSNGLRVISVDLKAVRTSAIGNLVYFTDSDSAEDFAKAIMAIDTNKPYDSRKAIENLDKQFTESLSELLNGEVIS